MTWPRRTNGSTASSPHWTTTRGDPRPARRAGASPTSCCTSPRPTRRSRPAPAPRSREAGRPMPPGSTTRPTAWCASSAPSRRWCSRAGAPRSRHRLSALRDAEPGTRLTWVAGTLKPATLATTRLAEHWAHGLDITGPLGIDFPDTDRLRHIAWLGHSTLPYAFSLAGDGAASGLLPADRAGRRDVDLRSGGRRVGASSAWPAASAGSAPTAWRRRTPRSSPPAPTDRRRSGSCATTPPDVHRRRPTSQWRPRPRPGAVPGQ